MKKALLIFVIIFSSSVSEQPIGNRLKVEGATVLDEQTGLRWKRCNVGQVPSTNNACLGKAKLFDFYQAQKLTNVKPQSDGFWRVPTKNELSTLLDKNKSGIKINTDVFPDARQGNSLYWSCDLYNDGAAWYVDFADGYVGYMSGDHSSTSDKLAVRLVRVEK